MTNQYIYKAELISINVTVQSDHLKQIFQIFVCLLHIKRIYYVLMLFASLASRCHCWLRNLAIPRWLRHISADQRSID